MHGDKINSANAVQMYMISAEISARWPGHCVAQPLQYIGLENVGICWEVNCTLGLHMG